MIVDRYDPINLFELVPKLKLELEPELAHLDELLDDDVLFESHSPRGLGGCLTTSTLHPSFSSIPRPCRRPCIPDRPIDAPSEGTLRPPPPTPPAPLHGPGDPPSAPWP
jgi:hypothetical protein